MNDRKQSDVQAQAGETKRTSLAREILTRDFWLTGLAMLRYIPRSLRVKRIDGMAFFTDGKYAEFRSRILQITVANPRQWGTMNVSQMLHHLNLACSGSLGFYTLPDESYLLSRTLFRWIWSTGSPTNPRGCCCPRISRFLMKRNLSSTSKSDSS